MKRDFRITAAVEDVAQRLELGPQLDMVVDLAVIDRDDVTVVAREGLIAAAKVDDLEPHRPQRHVVGVVCTLLVGSTVREQAGDPACTSAVWSAVPMSESRNAT